MFSTIKQKVVKLMMENIAFRSRFCKANQFNFSKNSLSKNKEKKTKKQSSKIIEKV